MTAPTPSPFPQRLFSLGDTMFLFVDGIDLTPWAERTSLQTASLQFAQGAIETMTVTLQNLANDNSPTPTLPPQPLPPIRAGIVPVMYVEYLSDDSTDYIVLFSGQAMKQHITDVSFAGQTILEVSTPMKALKQVLRSVRFFQQTTANDVERIRALGHKWGNVDFDFSLAEWGSGHNVTYLPPNIYFDGLYWVYNEPDKTYESRTVFDILMDIATDPGVPADTHYPVANRPWWLEARWRDSTDFTQGVVFVLVMRSGIPPDAPTGVDLTDDPRDGDYPTAVAYGQGATVVTDYTPVVRRVEVSGREPIDKPAAETFKASGSTDLLALFTPSAGWVRKIGGTDGAWDCTGIADHTSYQDVDFTFQVQETYLQHDPFQGDDIQALGQTSMWSYTDPAFPPGTWQPAYVSTDEAMQNSMARRGKRATPDKPTHSAFAVVDALAATCIVRAQIDHNVDGATIICRAAQDAFYNLTSAIMLVKNGTTYDLCTFDGASLTVLATSSHTAIDNEFIKINCKYNQLTVYFNDVIDNALTMEGFTFNAHETLFGIGCWDTYGGLWYQTTFRDFSVTEFWGDKAIGLGSELSGTDWTWIGYGFVFNTNGTYTLVQGGLLHGTLGCLPPGSQGDIDAEFAALDSYQAAHGGHLPPDVPYEWVDCLLAHDTMGTGFSYDDVFQVTSVLYQEADGSAKRKVQWWKQPGGSGEWVLLAEEPGIAADIIHYGDPVNPPPDGTPSVVWYHQVALKELGATFTNVAASTNFANTFLPPASIVASLVPLEGDYPATGTVQGQQLNTYALRERVAAGIFREYGNPFVQFTCQVPYTAGMQAAGVTWPFQRGQYLRVTCRRAGWTNDEAGDKRPLLVIRQVQRIPAGRRGLYPQFNLTLGTAYYDLSDPARSHLLRPDASVFVPATLGIPELTGMSYFFRDPVSADDHFGQYIEIQVRALGEAADGNYPIFHFSASDRKVQIPTGSFAPGQQFESRHRTVTKSGTPSAWSTWYPGTAPPAQAYDRPYTVNLPFGDAVNVIAVPVDSSGSVEMQINEAAAIVGWALVLNKAGSVTVDIEWASDGSRRDIGQSAYQSLPGLTGVKPYTLYSQGDGTANSGTSLTGWDAKRSNLKKGDWLRLIVSTVDAANTTATLGTLSLTCQRVGQATPHAGGGG